MPKDPDQEYFANRATNARSMAERAATPAARHIHLELAADYDQKAGVPEPCGCAVPKTQ